MINETYDGFSLFTIRINNKREKYLQMKTHFMRNKTLMQKMIQDSLLYEDLPNSFYITYIVSYSANQINVSQDLINKFLKLFYMFEGIPLIRRDTPLKSINENDIFYSDNKRKNFNRRGDYIYSRDNSKTNV